jgi:hypothetical protein
MEPRRRFPYAVAQLPIRGARCWDGIEVVDRSEQPVPLDIDDLLGRDRPDTGQPVDSSIVGGKAHGGWPAGRAAS